MAPIEIDDFPSYKLDVNTSCESNTIEPFRHGNVPWLNHGPIRRNLRPQRVRQARAVAQCLWGCPGAQDGMKKHSPLKDRICTSPQKNTYTTRVYDICIIMYIFVHMYGSASNSSSCRFFCWPPCTAIPTGPNTCTEVVPSCPANFTFRTTTVGGGDFDDMVMVHEGVMWKV